MLSALDSEMLFIRPISRMAKPAPAPEFLSPRLYFHVDCEIFLNFKVTSAASGKAVVFNPVSWIKHQVYAKSELSALYLLLYTCLFFNNG